MRKDRAQRYQNVQDLVLDLQKLRDDLQATAGVRVTPPDADAGTRANGGAEAGTAGAAGWGRLAPLAAAIAIVALGAGVSSAIVVDFWAPSRISGGRELATIDQRT